MITERITGTYHATAIAGENVSAFVPNPLPPAEPSLIIDDEMRAMIATAEAALARLSLAGEMVPSIDWFLYAFVRKEAVLSSQIEGTQATLVDLLEFEALEFARSELGKEKGLPLSLRLLNEVHARLMQGARGENKMPGELRRMQNWIGGSRPSNAVYVPPPAHLLSGLLSDFERFMHEGNDLPSLSRRKRSNRPSTRVVASRRVVAPEPPAFLPQPFLQTISAGVRPTSRRGSGRGRLGGMDSFLSRSRLDDR